MEEYFGMIINILMGLTFIVLMLIFLYMIFGEGKEKSSSTGKVAAKILQDISFSLYKIQALL